MPVADRILLGGGAVVAFGLGLGAAFAASNDILLSGTLVVVLALLTMIPIAATRYRRMPIDLLHPLVVVLAGSSLFLLVRPTYILIFQDYERIKSPLGGGTHGMVLALVLCIVSLGSVLIGYVLGKHLIRPRRTHTGDPREFRRATASNLFWSGIGFISAGSILYMSRPQSAAVITIQEIRSSASAYTNQSLDLVGVGMLLLTLSWSFYRSKTAMATLTVIGPLFLVVAAGAGGRYRIAYALAACIAAYALGRQRRIPLRVALAALPVWFVFSLIGAARAVSHGRSMTLDDADAALAEATSWTWLSSAGDLNIFDTLTKLAVVVPWDTGLIFPGRTAYYALVAPIPRSIWNNKPLPTETLVNISAISPDGNIPAGGGGLSYSLPGSLLVEGGFIGVVVFSMLIGILLAWIAIRMYQQRASLHSVAIYCSLYPFLFFAQRGGITNNDIVWLLTYLVPITAITLLIPRLFQKRA